MNSSTLSSAALLSIVLVAALCSGCATLTQESTQHLQIVAVDALDQPVSGLDCEITHEARGGPQTERPIHATLPAADVVVHRSGLPLLIDCRLGNDSAQATVTPRRNGLEQALVPFGSVAVFIDHLSGKMYEYPTELRLRLGQHLDLEHGGQARVASTTRLPGSATMMATAPAAVPPAAAAVTVRAGASVAPPMKTVAVRKAPGASSGRLVAGAPAHPSVVSAAPMATIAAPIAGPIAAPIGRIVPITAIVPIAPIVPIATGTPGSHLADRDDHASAPPTL